VWIEAFAAFDPQADPVEALIRGYLGARWAFHRHSDVTPYAFASPTTEDAVHFAALGIAQIFEQAGFVGRSAGEAYHVIATYTFGSAMLHAERTLLDRQIRRPVSDLADLAGGPLPEGTGEAYESVRDALGNDPDLVRFEKGLRAIVAGLLADAGINPPAASGSRPD